MDQHGHTSDCLLTAYREKAAALHFLKNAIRRHGVSEKMTIDGSEANEAAIKCYTQAHGPVIVIRQVTYFNNLVEQGQRGVKRITRPMLGFTSFDAAQSTLAGIERMHRIKKKQMVVEAGDEGRTAVEQFYSLAAYSPHRSGQLSFYDLLRKICDATFHEHYMDITTYVSPDY